MDSITKTDIYSINVHSPMAICDFSNYIYNTLIEFRLYDWEKLLILCIGSDRSTGDSLGPLVGYKLKPLLSKYEKIDVLGTLEEPVHAKNLNQVIDKINKDYSNPLILAIDASLGQFHKIGFVNLKKGPIKPGLGVNKNLPHIGDISITGVVNVGGMMEYVVLQNTRLSIVMKMADVISKSIFLSIIKYEKVNLDTVQ